MAQTMYASAAIHDRTSSFNLPHMSMTPSSPDPAPLRMLAFSVAEAALQSNPNSPMFHQLATKIPTPPKVKVVDPAAGGVEWPMMITDEAMMAVPSKPTESLQHQRWSQVAHAAQLPKVVAKEQMVQATKGTTIAQRRNRELWNVIERAKERKQTSFEEPLPSPPPLSPTYNFTLPPNSPLAESIAADYITSGGSGSSTSPSTPRRPNRRELLASLGRVNPLHAGMYTRSAELSPTQSTFSGLDQSRPPPEFVPRLTAKEFSAKSSRIAESTKAKHARTQSDADSPDLVSPTESVFPVPMAVPAKSVHRVNRTPQRLPSLQQIQAKMTRVPSPQAPGRAGKALAAHRRSGSEDSLPAPTPKAAFAISAAQLEQQVVDLSLDAQTRPAACRKDSEDSVESDILQTPEDEVSNPLRDRRLALQVIMNRRPPTPPSPSKERFLPFLRERTSDRMASAKTEIPRPSSALGTSSTAINGATAGGNVITSTPPVMHPKPVLRVTPPSLETRPAVPPLKFYGENNGTPSPTSSFMLGRLARQARAAQGGGNSDSPTDLRFTPPARLSTPPLRALSHTYGSRPTTPISPTGSIRSLRSFSGTPLGGSRAGGSAAGTGATNSPTMPIITCTPAADESSDDGQSEPDVVVCDPVAEMEEEREQRERMGNAMRSRLGLRRRSID